MPNEPYKAADRKGWAQVFDAMVYVGQCVSELKDTLANESQASREYHEQELEKLNANLGRLADNKELMSSRAKDEIIASMAESILELKNGKPKEEEKESNGDSS